MWHINLSLVIQIKWYSYFKEIIIVVQLIIRCKTLNSTLSNVKIYLNKWKVLYFHLQFVCLTQAIDRNCWWLKRKFTKSWDIYFIKTFNVCSILKTFKNWIFSIDLISSKFLSVDISLKQMIVLNVYST